MPSSKRELLVDTAIDLFYRDGFHATGIDKILAESGVAKMTLYKHFKSKDELILAALRKRDEIFRNDFMNAVAARAKAPRDRLLAVFDVLGDWFATRGFSGCIFAGGCGFGLEDQPDQGNPHQYDHQRHKHRFKWAGFASLRTDRILVDGLAHASLFSVVVADSMLPASAR